VHRSSRQFRQLAPNAEPDVVLTDDGGSGLLEACQTRFAAPEYVVTCDARHTVWVKRADGARSVGLPPWILRQHSLEVALDRMELKLLGLPVTEH
jgi:hypothetical protein